MWKALVLVMFFTGCSHVPGRRLASEQEDLQLGEVDYRQSLVQIFPGDIKDELISYYLYVQLKNPQGEFVDFDQNEFSLRNNESEKINFTVERVLRGRYYIKLEKRDGVEWKTLDLLLQGKALREKFKLSISKPSRKFSSIKLLKKLDGKIILRLKIADRHNRKLELPDVPEIWFDGAGEISEIKHTSEGEWEFTFSYPEVNQVIYFTVRASGVSFRKLYRFQHIEK